MHQIVDATTRTAAAASRSGCFHLAPRPSAIQQGLVRLYMHGMNFILRHWRQPEVAMTRLVQLNRWLCGMQTRYQKAGPFIWPYLEGGTGVPVVLLHGYGADKDGLRSLVPFLRRRFRVIAPDLPGFGEHLPDWRVNYDVDSQVARLEAFIKALDLHRFHLLGLSLGGYVAARYTIRFPHRILSLGLMDSAGFSSPVPSDAERLYACKGRNIFLYTDEHQMEQLIQFLLHRPVKLPPSVRRYWTRQKLEQYAWRRKLFDDLMAGGLDLLDSQAHLIKAPTLVIWGAEDRICHVSAVDRIRSSVEDCRAYIIHGCGHIPMIEYPMLFRRIYLGYLAGLGAGGAVQPMP